MNAQAGTSQKFYGKYRAIVVNNVDPLLIGRIQVIVPDVGNLAPTTWAMSWIEAPISSPVASGGRSAQRAISG